MVQMAMLILFVVTEVDEILDVVVRTYVLRVLGERYMRFKEKFDKHRTMIYLFDLTHYSTLHT